MKSFLFLFCKNKFLEMSLVFAMAVKTLTNPTHRKEGLFLHNLHYNFKFDF